MKYSSPFVLWSLMIVLGLDVSSACTGYSLASETDGYIEIVSFGTIEPSAKLTMGAKLVYFEKEIRKLLKRFQPDEIVEEEIFRGPNIKTFKVLAMFRAISLKTIWEKTKKEPLFIMPSEARKAVGAGITKEEAFAFVVNKYGLNDFTFAKHNDICDAIILALAYFQPRPEPKPKKKRKHK